MEKSQEKAEFSEFAGVCRACLVPCPEGKCLLSDDNYTLELISRLQAVAHVQIIRNKKFPSKLCTECEEKTITAFQFQETCQNSDSFVRSVLGLKKSYHNDMFTCNTCNKRFIAEKLLEKHISKEHSRISRQLKKQKGENRRKNSLKNSKIDEESKSKPTTEPRILQEDDKEKVAVKRESFSEEDNVLNDDYNANNDDCDDYDDKDYLEEDFRPEVKKIKTSKFPMKIFKTTRKVNKVAPNGMKLKQFAKENVESVVQTIKKRMEESKTCRFCNFTSHNPRSLCFHISMVHKNFKATWCWICNDNFENLKEHSKTHRKDLECPFCKRVSKNNSSLISHLYRHTVSLSIRCKSCDMTFERQDLLERHNTELHPAKLGPAAMQVKEMRLKKRLEAGLRQKSRVAQYPNQQVDAEIKKIEGKLNSSVDCPFCSFTATNRSTLGTHIAGTHKQQRDGWCFMCNQTGIENLKEHKEKEHVADNSCVFCKRKVIGVTRLIEHLMRHSESKGVKCPQCEKTFITERYMEKHQKIHDEVNNLTTAVTKQDEDYSSDDDMKLSEVKSMAGKHGIFDKIKTDEEIKEEIIKIEVEKKPTPIKRYCKICKKNVSCLATHVKLVHSEEPEASHLCSDCGKTFASKSNLNAHMKLHSDVRPHKCSYCSLSFHIHSSLRIHLRKHTKEKPYICNVCGKAFARSGQLTTHMRIHTGKPFLCSMCEKRFCRPSELRIHMRKHTGETPYVCDICGKGFTHTSNMYNHRRTHFGERPYPCRYCGKTFSQTDSRNRHEFVHKGIKPFKCRICTFSCIKSYDLTKHMMSHGDSDQPMLDKPYECEVCTKRFQTKSHLFSHFDMYHQSSQYTQENEKVQ